MGHLGKQIAAYGQHLAFWGPRTKLNVLGMHAHTLSYQCSGKFTFRFMSRFSQQQIFLSCLPCDRLTVQFSSVAQSTLTLCDPMNHSTPGLPVHHQLPEFTQTHVHRVGDAIQPSHPLSSPTPPAFTLLAFSLKLLPTPSGITGLHVSPCTKIFLASRLYKFYQQLYKIKCIL